MLYRIKQDSGNYNNYLAYIRNERNLHLYGYCSNNPIKYTDPDGKVVRTIENEKVATTIEYLYKNSKLFKEQFNKLLSPTNGIYQNFILIVTSYQDKFAGNLQTNNSLITKTQDVMRLDRKGNILKYKLLPSEKEYQAVFINIDLDRINSKHLNIYEVVSEEVCHAADCISYGADAWNEKCKKEDAEYSYFDKPREQYAKELTRKILEELDNEK